MGHVISSESFIHIFITYDFKVSSFHQYVCACLYDRDIIVCLSCVGKMIRVRSCIAFLAKNKNIYGVRGLCTNTSKTTNGSEPELPSTADVVIVGGGVTGCSVLYQLSKRGVKALLLERGKVTCGTTFR